MNLSPRPSRDPPTGKVLKAIHKSQKIEPPIKTSNLLKTNNQTIKERKENELFDTFTWDHVPSSFVSKVKYFYLTAKEIEEFWRMALIVAYRNNREQEKDTVLEFAIQSFKQMIGKLKSTRSVKKPIAYFYGVLNKKLENLYIQELAEMGFWENGGEMRFFTPRNIIEMLRKNRSIGFGKNTSN